MNKIIAFVSLAVAYFIAASAYPVDPGWENVEPAPIPAWDDVESQLSLAPSNDEEISGLDGKSSIFSDFCISTRDEVIGDIRTKSNGAAGNLFMTFFNGAENLGLEAISVNQNAAQKLGEQIRDPSKPIEAVDENNEIDSIIADGQKKIQEDPSQPRSLFQGIVSALSATKNLVASQVIGKLNELKAGFGLMTAAGYLKDACDRIEQYDNLIHERFQQIKTELAAQDPSLADATIENVNCVTARRIIRLDGMCKFALAAKDPLMKAITLKSSPQ